MQTESKGKVYECLHCWPRWHDLIKWNICAAYVLMSDTRPRPGLQITVVCQRVAFQTKSVLALMSREEQCGWAEAQAGYWVRNRARLEGGTQQPFRDATFGMECTHPDILETSQRKNNWASLVTVVNFSQVHQGLGWQQLWLSGEQHTEEKGRRKMTSSPAASGPKWEVAPRHRVCLRLPISASSRTGPPLRSTLLVVTAGQWGRPGTVLGLCCSPGAPVPAVTFLRGTIPYQNLSKGWTGREAEAWDHHGGGGFPSISPMVNIKVLLWAIKRGVTVKRCCLRSKNRQCIHV